MKDELATIDAVGQAALVRSRQVKPSELVEAAIRRIEAGNERLNAVIHPAFERAIDRARQLDAEHTDFDDDSPPLLGVPFLMKDLGGQEAGAPFHMGIRALKNAGWVAPEDSYLVQRLRTAGIVSLGRTNTPELGLLPTTEPLACGPTRNPWDLERSPGGSSGGASAAVSAGFVPAAHASDGGGSIRTPAAHTGLVGLKPTRGRSSFGPALKKVFVLLRAQTGHDFSRYKPSTINRRIERRMAVHQIDSVDGYVKYLQQAPPEVEALFRDLLIGVTSFFRDPEVFQVLEERIIPRLFDDKPAGALVRVWSAGCSTGEEAYSTAILLQERMKALKQSYVVQLFATDIDSRAVATARAGLYPGSIVADLTADRLARFFTAEPDGGLYRIKKSIRDMMVFSEQDVIRDPPFSKLDLIVCRNLLIYLGLELQKKLIPLFHYALKPGGFLFLGTSEGIGDFGELFTAVDRKSKLYQRTEHSRGIERAATKHLVPPITRIDVSVPRDAKRPAPPPKPPLRELTEQALLQQIAPASLLVNREGDILYQHGRTGMYLEPAPGESGVNNILKMAREGLRRDLTVALHKAATTRDLVRCPGLRVKTNGHFTFVNLTVCPVTAGTAGAPAFPGPESHLYLVILDEAPAAAAEAVPPAAVRAGAAAKGAASAGHSEAEATITALKEDLRARDEYLQSAHEELESSNEELKSSNEEMQSVNEELQSTNEELETSKEELQSVNEEIGTVNTELQTKVADLSRANNDMSNLLAGTGIGTVFVDFQLRILRFTPAASEFINLIAGDVGRPVAHLASNLVGYDQLVKDVQAVLNTLIPKEISVQTIGGKWNTMRILPYRTLDNVIEGAVITFADITETVKTREALHKANELARLAVVLRDAHDAITVQDLDGRILAWNPGAMRMYGWSEAEALLMNVRDRIPLELRGKALATLEQLSRAETIEPYRTQRITKQGLVIAVSIVSTALLNEAGEVYAIATTERRLGSDKP